MKISPRLMISMAVGAAGVAATYLWKRKKVSKTSIAPASAFDQALATSVFGKKIKENDLTAIEGIGPKIAELLHGAGIETWSDLSQTSVKRCQEILDSADGFSLHDPATWPKQAKLAAKDKWQELKDWQEKLKGGK